MADVETLNIALSSEMISKVRAAVDSGEFATPSDVIVDALQGWSSQRTAQGPNSEELRRLVQIGVNSGPSVEAEPVFARLRAKYVAMS